MSGLHAFILYSSCGEDLDRVQNAYNLFYANIARLFIDV
jgi:hypothetical protein